MQVNYYSLAIGLLGASKLILNSFGLDIITDNDINAIANGAAAVATVVGVYMNHKKKYSPTLTAGMLPLSSYPAIQPRKEIKRKTPATVGGITSAAFFAQIIKTTCTLLLRKVSALSVSSSHPDLPRSWQ